MSQLDRTRPPAPAAVRDFIFPDINHTQLSNGLMLFAVPHGSLPIVTFRLVVSAGAEHDTPDVAGLAYLTARALEAGTRTRSADRLAWDFEKLGAELDVDVVWDYAALTVTVPADRAEAGVALLAEVVLQPAFQSEEIERLRDEQLAELLQRDAEPRALANDEALRFIYADSSPYQRPLPGVPRAVRNLDVGAVTRSYQQGWTAGSAALVAAGAITEETLRDLASRHFGEWSGAAQQTVADTKAAKNNA